MTRIHGALVSDGPAWLLAQLLPPAAALAHRLDANDVGEPLRQATLEAHAAILAEGAEWAKRAATTGRPRTAADDATPTAGEGGNLTHMPCQEFMTSQQFADRLGVSERTVRRHIAAGDIPAVHLGRCVRVHRDTPLTHSPSPKATT